MRRTVGALFAIALVILGASVIAQQNAPAPTGPVPAGLPEWAYTPPVPGAPPAPSALPADDNAVVRIPGTDRTFTRGELRATKETMDWFPAERHGTADRIIFLEGDLLFVLPENLRGQVDAVVSNPPYVPKSQRPSLPREVRDFEPAVAIIALEKGTEIHQRLIAESPRWLRPASNGAGLRPAGLLVLEAGAGQAEAVAAALAEDGRYERARRLRDVAGAERVVLAALRYSPAALSEDGIGGSGSQRANY